MADLYLPRPGTCVKASFWPVYTQALFHYVCLGAFNELYNIAPLLLWKLEIIQRCIQGASPAATTAWPGIG